jgi:Ca2+-binding EF-hand superfamily protein
LLRLVVIPFRRFSLLLMLFIPRHVGERKEAEDAVSSTHSILDKVNAVLVIANIKATIKSIPQLRLTAPVLFIRVFESFYWKKIPGINYSPESAQDHERNMDLLLNELRKMYGYESLTHLTGIDIIGGKQSAIETVLDIFYGIHAVVQQKPQRKGRSSGNGTQQTDQNDLPDIFQQVSSLQDLQAQVLATTEKIPTLDDNKKHHKSAKKVRPSSAPSNRLLKPTIASSYGLQVLDQKYRPPSPPLLQRPSSRGAVFGRSGNNHQTSPTTKPPPPDPAHFYDSWSGRKVPIEQQEIIQERNLKKLLSRRHPEMLEPPAQPKPKKKSSYLQSEFPGNRTEKSVENYNLKMKLQRELPFEDKKKKNSSVEFFSQPNSSIGMYRYLVSYDLLISIEHCHHCEQHSKVLRHQSIEYHQHALDIFRTLLYAIYSLTLPLRVGIVKFQADLTSHHNGSLDPTAVTGLSETPSRIGAFEVQIAYKDQKNQLHVNLLHSKLSTQKWPSKNVIKKRLLSFITSCNIPTISRDRIPSYLFTSSSSPEFSLEDISYDHDGLDSYPVGVLPWNKLNISSMTWEYPEIKADDGTAASRSINSTENHILRIFDFRLDSIPPSPYPIGSEVEVADVLNSYGFHEKYEQLGIIKFFHKKENKLKIQLKYLEAEIEMPCDKCHLVLLEENNKSSRKKSVAIEYFTVLTSFFTSAQSLLSLNSALSSTSYSTITPTPQRTTTGVGAGAVGGGTSSALNTGRASIPYVYFILFNLSMYLTPKNSNQLVSNIQWKIMNPSDYSLPRQMDEEDEEEEEEEEGKENGNGTTVIPGDDFYLTRQSFFCQIYELVWNALIQANGGDGDDDPTSCQYLQIESNLSLSEVMKSGIKLSSRNSSGTSSFFNIDLQLCYSEELLDWTCHRFGNKINMTELIKLARPSPPPSSSLRKNQNLLSKSSSNMSSDSSPVEVKEYGKSFSYQLDEEDLDHATDVMEMRREEEGEEKRNENGDDEKEIRMTTSLSNETLDKTAGAAVVITSTSIKNQLLLMTEEVLEEEKKQQATELEKQQILGSISNIVQDAIANSTDEGEMITTPPLVPSLSSPSLRNFQQITSSLKSRIQQICLRIAPPEENSLEATEAGNYLQTSKYKRGVLKLFHIFQNSPFVSPRVVGGGGGGGVGHTPHEDEIELDMNQFNSALSKFGIDCNENELMVLWATLDVDGNTHISPPELLSFLHHQSQIGYRQLGEIWNTLQKCFLQKTEEEEDDMMKTFESDENEVPALSLLEEMELEMSNSHSLIPSPPSPSNPGTSSSSSPLLIPANEFFDILKRFGMYSLLKSGDANILVAYFGVDISGKPMTDSILLLKSPIVTPRADDDDDDDEKKKPLPSNWNDYLIRFDDFFSWLQPIDFQKVSKRISRFLTALINNEGGLGLDLDSTEEEKDEVMNGIPLREVDPGRTGFIQRKLFQVYVDKRGLPLTTAEVRTLFRHFGESSDHSLMKYDKLQEMLQCSTKGINHKILPLIGGGSFRKLSIASPPKSCLKEKRVRQLNRIDSNPAEENGGDQKDNTKNESSEDKDQDLPLEDEKPKEFNQVEQDRPQEVDLPPFSTPPGGNVSFKLDSDEDHVENLAPHSRGEPCAIQIRISMIEFESQLFDTDPLYDSLIFQMKTSRHDPPSQLREIELNLTHKHGAGKRFIDELEWDPLDIYFLNESFHISLLSLPTPTAPSPPSPSPPLSLGHLDFIPMNSLEPNPRRSQCLSFSLPLPNTQHHISLQIHCRVKDTVNHTPSHSEKITNTIETDSSLPLPLVILTNDDTTSPSPPPPHSSDHCQPPLSTVKSISQFDREFNDLYSLQFTEDGDDDENDGSHILLDSEQSNNEFLEQFGTPTAATSASTAQQPRQLLI